MLKGIYDAASGMLPQVIRQDATAHNLANANTAGFKRELVIAQEFSKAQQQTAPGQTDWEMPQVAEIAIDFSQGSIEETGNNLHLALDGDAFFVVNTPNGEMTDFRCWPKMVKFLSRVRSSVLGHGGSSAWTVNQRGR